MRAALQPGCRSEHPSAYLSGWRAGERENPETPQKLVFAWYLRQVGLAREPVSPWECSRATHSTLPNDSPFRAGGLCIFMRCARVREQVVPVLGGLESAAALLAGHAPGVAVGVAAVLW